MIQLAMRDDHGITTLLGLHDQIIDQGDGYWIKIEAWVVSVSVDRPHGIRYSLTLHEPYAKPTSENHENDCYWHHVSRKNSRAPIGDCAW